MQLTAVIAMLIKFPRAKLLSTSINDLNF